ncbi:sulfatase-like hydrolase/transferase [Haloarcula halobia]|uniref:sulfatase-like hydrolase/transferase n=1 Tax=Haloarcula halobia TaxID=3033388 RepID=UPI0023ED0ADE|nr:sulfatase-like hydrolase/transferase [Halomicroarcula sp. XH51]
MTRKNIVLAVADTMSAFHLPYYGYNRETAPFISELIKKSWVADSGYANAPFTGPSHASIFTGNLPHEHNFTTETMYLTGCDLLTQLQHQGYETMGITNNSFITPEFGFTGWDKHTEIEDFEKFVGYPALQALFKSDGQPSPSEQIKTLVREAWWKRDFISLEKATRLKLGKNPLSPFPDAGARVTIKRAKQWMQQTDNPFFLYLNFMETHMPYDPPDEFATEFVSDPVKAKRKLADGYRIGRNRKSFRWEEKDDDTIRAARALYDSSIRYLDSQLKLLWEWIQTNKQDTIFILISDHGELIGEHGMQGHQCGIWEKLLRVPIIIHEPGVPAKLNQIT